MLTTLFVALWILASTYCFMLVTYPDGVAHGRSDIRWHGPRKSEKPYLELFGRIAFSLCLWWFVAAVALVLMLALPLNHWFGWFDGMTYEE